MHNTTVVTNTGEKYHGCIRKFHPELGYFEFFDGKQFLFSDCNSVLTEGERGGQIVDEILRAKKYLAQFKGLT